MHITVYLAIMLTLSTIIAALLLLLAVLERRPQDWHTAVEQPLELDQLSPGRREPGTRGRARARLAVQRAIRNRRSEARRRLDARRRKIILGSPPSNDDAEDERDQGREAFQGWASPVPTTVPGPSPSATASGQTNG